jgi:GTP-binding protein EngB required for normal cell division
MRALLEQLANLADESGARAIADDARELLERVAKGRFFVACLGQFKRGKSSLINALLGEALLPAGVVPVTSVVTVVRWGARRVRVRTEGTGWRDIAPAALDEYVSEAKNPENAKQVRGVEVSCPSPLLEGGLCLVDTPGIGSIFGGNTEETRAFVPQVDAAVVVVGGDPPISGEELALAKDVAGRVRDVLFVLNKADRLTDAERDEARAFTARVLRERLGGAEAELFEVSALERLEHRGPARQWDAFVERLRALVRASGAELVERAATRGLAALLARLERHLRESRDALVRPVEASEARLETLRRCAREAEQAALELRYLFDAEQQRLLRALDERRARFVDEAMGEVTRRLDAELAANATRRGPGLRTFAVTRALELTEPLVRAWLDQQRPVAEQEFVAVTERFVSHANAFLERLRAAGQLEAEALPPDLAPERAFRARSRFTFASFMARTTPPAWRWLADWFLPAAQMRAAVRAAGLSFAARLLEANGNRVVGDFDERITESRRGVESALRRRLLEVVGTAEAAAQRAAALRQQGAEAVSAEVHRLEGQLARLASLAPASSPASG